MSHVLTEPAKAGAEFESGEYQFVNDDGREPGQRDWKRVAMEQRNAEQGQREQYEINGYSKDKYGLDQNTLNTQEQPKR